MTFQEPSTIYAYGRPVPTVRVWEVWGERAGQKVREFPHPRMVWTVAYLREGRELGWSSTDGTVQAHQPYVILHSAKDLRQLVRGPRVKAHSVGKPSPAIADSLRQFEA